MQVRNVISFVMDLIGSTAIGLQMSDPRFRKFNQEVVNQIWPYLEKLGLGDVSIKFTGDGWLIFHHDIAKIRAFVALAKTLSIRFRQDIADKMDMDVERVPPLRLAICTGHDAEIKLQNGHTEWVGHSARRATRIADCAAPGELIIGFQVRDVLSGEFDLTEYDVRDLPPEQQPKRWEENMQIFRVDDLREDFLEDARFTGGAEDYKPYVYLLEWIGEDEKARRLHNDIARRTVLALGGGDGIGMPIPGAAAALTPQPPPPMSQPPMSQPPMSQPPVSQPVSQPPVSQPPVSQPPQSHPPASTPPAAPASAELGAPWVEVGEPGADASASQSQNATPPVSHGPTTMVGIESAAPAESATDERTPAYNARLLQADTAEAVESLLAEMTSDGVPVDTVTYNILIKQAPDLSAALTRLDEMQGGHITVNEATLSALASHVTDIGAADVLVGEMRARHLFLGKPFFSELYEAMIAGATAEQLLDWHKAQPERPNTSLGAPILRLHNEGRLNECFVLAELFPDLEESRDAFRAHPEEAETYYERRLADDPESAEATYALGAAIYESGRKDDGRAMIRKAREIAMAALGI